MIEDATVFITTLQAISPGNEHPLPIAEAWDGTHWTVDIQIRTNGTDLDATASDTDLSHARTKAIRRIRKTRTMYIKHGKVDN